MSKLNTNFLCLLLVLFTVGCQDKTTTSPPNPKIEMQAAIDSLLEQKYTKGTFNGNVLVVKNGEDYYQKSFGYADGAKTIKLTKDFRFNIGSIYKEFPAVAIMQLEEKGKLSLDDHVAKYLSGLPDWSADVTIKQLLTYSSGLPRIDFGKYFGGGIVLTEQHLMDDLNSLGKLSFEPGTDYLYSNNNPFLLTKIVAQVSNQSFPAYVEKHFFQPFGLKSTVLKAEFPYQDKNLMALPFNKEFQEDAFKLKTPAMLFSPTTSDLNKWLEALHSFKIINKTSLMMLTETAAIDGKSMQAPLGTARVENDQIISHIHHGSSGNYEGLIQRFNQDDLTIIILTNQKNKNVFEIAEEIKKVVMGETK